MFVPQKKQVGCLVVTLVLTVGISNALAVPVIVDPGFEPSATQYNPSPSLGISCADSMTGEPCNLAEASSWLWWEGPSAPTNSGNTGIQRTGAGILNGLDPVEGDQAAMLQRTPFPGDTFAAGHAQISQDVAGWDAGVPYELSLAIRDRFPPPGGGEILLTASVGGAPIPGLTNVAAGFEWATVTSDSFTAPAGTNELKLRIEAGATRFLFVDNLQLTVVPEPGCLLLVGLAGGFGIGFFRRTGRSG